MKEIMYGISVTDIHSLLPKFFLSCLTAPISLTVVLSRFLLMKPHLLLSFFLEITSSLYILTPHRVDAWFFAKLRFAKALMKGFFLSAHFVV